MMPVFTTGPVGAFILYIWLKYKMFHTKLSKEEKKEMIRRFNNENLSDTEQPTRFIVGTSPVLGVGWTPARAFR